MRDKTEEVHSYVPPMYSLCPGNMCLLKGPLQASKANTNTENCCLSLEQATCLLNNSLAVWQWDGISHSWGLGPSCHPKLLPLQLHSYNGPTRAPLHRHRLCMVVPHLWQKSSVVSTGLLLVGLCVFDARGQCIYPLRSFWCRTFLRWCSVLLGKRRLCGTYLQKCGCPGDFLGINRGKKGLWACLKRGSNWTVVLRLRCLNLFVDYTHVIWSRTLQKYPCLCPLYLATQQIACVLGVLEKCSDALVRQAVCCCLSRLYQNTDPEVRSIYLGLSSLFWNWLSLRVKNCLF